MTILVTGGAGFIGSNFVLNWFASPQTQGEEVVTLDALTYAGNLQNLAALQTEIERIDAWAERIGVPLSYTHELYALRGHIQLVRQRIVDRAAAAR